MKVIRLPGKIEKGRFIPSSSRNWQNALKLNEGKQVTITIGRMTKERSNPQNSYLWGVVYRMIADETGNSTDDVHEEMKRMFLTTQTSGPIPMTKSTTKLTTVEFQAYFEKIIQWAAEFLNMYIPLPDENEMWHSLEESIDGRKSRHAARDKENDRAHDQLIPGRDIAGRVGSAQGVEGVYTWEGKMSYLQCHMCEGETDFYCDTCGEPVCEDCCVQMTYHNQIDYPLCQDCYDGENARMSIERSRENEELAEIKRKKEAAAIKRRATYRKPENVKKRLEAKEERRKLREKQMLESFEVIKNIFRGMF